RPGVAAALFEPLGAASISVDVIVQNVGVTGATDITFTVAEDELPQAVALVQRANQEIGANEVLSSGGLAKLSIVGTGMLGTPGIAARMFKTLAEQKINIEMISTSEIRITCLVDRARAGDGVRALHTAFDLDLQ
ncbi:MAG: ACT domain-containing protein, partial [Chloroflexi bacterium]